MTKIELDVTDHRILRVLRQEGRISNLDLAQRVGLSPTPCSRRVRRLETSGVITGYSAQINPTAMGHGVTVMVNIRLSRQGPADIEEFLAAVKRMPEVTECLLVTGNLDYILKARARDVEELKDFVLAKLKKIPCVSDTTTMLILETIKQAD
ncbi:MULTISPECIES: Lrp/AsnC family transcriptional regulator [Falsihalocynthiibacter]|uniref:AsnC family transcriptional regulator n=1 Tax=Falsihalocynthiibacter arcticus TaxID=1579316 RepID=A0A126V2V5_9RHOB|nr:Lrp/AsnC family transcriptional regulator [Falsihalocynthiibacter arcticus]AML52275.1 AsnC family transcriptional regulator [Falsihalocynthiibacter arcticus]